MLPVPEGDKEWYLYAARAGLLIGVASHRRDVSLNTIARREAPTSRPAPPPFSSIMARRRRWLAAYEKVIDELKADGVTGPTRLNEDIRARIGHVYNRIIHIRPTPRVSRALSDEWDPATAESDFLDGDTGVVVLDNFLTKEALENVRLFCLDFDRVVGQPLQPWPARRVFP